ncbi:hypothetical protein BCR44DRAFT_69152 [Catenaria anguillulae PL171]|uniref:Uncharacterized protein n=1 Tax=Catenaria anguillulae PL171 TaxID=765915 RepID=A0A1Y2H4C2_9FUNG|nr:hypothetical protein BCR44DRAFT_69152 [Catenaria anguillulae PL171]
MADQIKSALGMKPSTAARFSQRDDRVKHAQTIVSQGNRQLSRERSAIDRKEAKLLAEVRRYLLQGNTHSAHLVARQIASYRRLAARNLEASLAMDLKLHAMASNNTVNRRQWETLKAIKGVHGGADDIKSVTTCAAKATRAMETANAVEAIMNETMDDVYDFAGDEVEIVGVQRSVSVDSEVEEILKQAVDAAMPRTILGNVNASVSPTRSTASSTSSRSRSPSPNRSSGTLLFVKLASNPDVGASVAVDSLDVSVDMVKRAILQDPYAVHQLGLARGAVGTARNKSPVIKAASAVGPCWPFSLGLAVESDQSKDHLTFEVLPIDQSLKSLGVQAGMVLFVQVHSQ